MNASGPFDSHRLQVHAHQARVAETSPARTRSVADPAWRRATVAVGHAVGRIRRVNRRILTLPEPGPVDAGQPAVLGRHLRPDVPRR